MTSSKLSALDTSQNCLKTFRNLKNVCIKKSAYVSLSIKLQVADLNIAGDCFLLTWDVHGL